jgi:hypothetical protein
MWSVPRYKQGASLDQTLTRVEAGSNTFTVTLRVVGGDEKGSLKFETVNCGHESQGTRTRGRLRWRGPAAYTKDRPVFSSERAPHKNKTITHRDVGFSDFVHRPDFSKITMKNTTFRKRDLFPSSGEGRHLLSWAP